MNDRIDKPNPARAAKVAAPAEVQPATPVKRRSRLTGLLVWLVVLIVLGGIGYGIYHLATTQPTPEPRGRRFAGAQSSVGVATVANGTIHVFTDALGTVAPLATVNVTSQVSGQLQQVAFKEGQMVKKGDFLAQIDPRPYEAQKAQYEGQLARDQGVLDQAKKNAERYQNLLNQNAIAKQTAEDQAFVVEQNEGTVKTDQALVDAQALNIGYTRIVSPIDGRVGLRLVDEGNYVQASSTSGIAVITQMDPISVLFPVAEDQLGAIAPQVTAGKQLQATIFDRTNTTQLALGMVTTLDNQIDTTTGTVKLRAQFDNADGKLFPNQFVNVHLLVNTLDNVMVVPTAAIQQGAPGAYVYVIGDDNKAVLRPVTVGANEGDKSQITKGLNVGEHVVTEGGDRLRDGASVNVANIDGKPAPGQGGTKTNTNAASGDTAQAPAAGGDTTQQPAAGAAQGGNASGDATGKQRDPSKRRHKRDQNGQSGQTGQSNTDGQ